MSDMVGTPNCWFSQALAQIIITYNVPCNVQVWAYFEELLFHFLQKRPMELRTVFTISKFVQSVISRHQGKFTG